MLNFSHEKMLGYRKKLKEFICAIIFLKIRMVAANREFFKHQGIKKRFFAAINGATYL